MTSSDLRLAIYTLALISCVQAPAWAAHLVLS